MLALARGFLCFAHSCLKLHSLGHFIHMCVLFWFFQTAFGHDDYIQALAYSAHTESLFSAGCDNAVMQWNLGSQMDRPLRNMTRGAAVFSSFD